MDLTELSKEHHEQMKKAGFYDEERNFGELLMLCVTELAEAMQANRKNGVLEIAMAALIEVESQKNDDLFKSKYEFWVKDSIPQELAGAILRILDICAYLEIDIQKFVNLEMRYNRLRPQKHGKKY